LQSLQHSDGGFDSVKVAYYVVESLSHLGAKPLRTLDKFVESLRPLIENLGKSDVYVEAISEIEALYFAVEMLKSNGSLQDAIELQKQIFKMQNTDGSFGSKKFSRIASTFYALKTLKLLDYDLKKLRDTLKWIRRCELPSGGFTAEPELSSKYMVIEDVYFGVKTLEVLNERCLYPKETLKLIAKFQNPNGGFRRSIFLGISDFESTYQAVSIFKTLSPHF